MLCRGGACSDDRAVVHIRIAADVAGEVALVLNGKPVSGAATVTTIANDDLNAANPPGCAASVLVYFHMPSCCRWLYGCTSCTCDMQQRECGDDNASNCNRLR